jgi:microcompartment protein CcmK/EutM
MILCKVIGTVVSVQKDDTLRPAKLLVVKPVDLKGNFTKERDMIAIDAAGAGEGDLVLIAQEGSVVEQVMKSTVVPANTIVMAIVEGMDIHEPSST